LNKKKDDKKEALKNIIKNLDQNADAKAVKKEFKDLLKDITPADISQVEEELIREGMPREQIMKLCDIHLAVMQETFEKEKTIAPQGHPIGILMEEHKIILETANNLYSLAGKLSSVEDIISNYSDLKKIIRYLKETESHYTREENILFPYLEKKGITQPPAIMWIEHDQIREIEKKIYEILDKKDKISFKNFAKNLKEHSIGLTELLSSHFYKENNILFPTAMDQINGDEWLDIRSQFDDLGYCCFTPPIPSLEYSIKEEAKGLDSEALKFESGNLTLEEVENIFNSLPVDVTFIDNEDTVKYFSQSKDRIFVRTKAIVGRKVQNCHPHKSLHRVNEILAAFKKGEKDEAEFWINLEDRLIYIRYFPVRTKNGEYIGTLEVTQDITDIKNIKGEKRLLDWK
jgi:DUF438 domain-containing protein